MKSMCFSRGIFGLNTKTVVKTRGSEKYDKEKGLAMAIIKKITGNTRNYYEIFKEWCGNEE